MYRYQVCAAFVTTDGAFTCSDLSPAASTFPAAAPPPPAGEPPIPRVVRHHAGDTWIGIWSEAGYDYSSYFVNTTDKPTPGNQWPRPRTIHHDDDGTWGYQRGDGLAPRQSYLFQVPTISTSS
jgi:hypothetical protein